MSVTITAILLFWFGSISSDGKVSTTIQQQWWKKDPQFDILIRNNYEQTLKSAINGELDDWLNTPKGSLAFIILLDQFSRNMYRDTAKAFSQDALALNVAKQSIAKQFDQQLQPIERVFMYMPFEHSEDLAMQKRSIELFTNLRNSVDKSQHDIFDGFLLFAQKHYDIIEKFGRFPHRNQILKRATTDSEHKFLQQPGSSF